MFQVILFLTLILTLLCVWEAIDRLYRPSSNESYAMINMYCIPSTEIEDGRYKSDQIDTVPFTVRTVDPQTKPTCAPGNLATIYKPGVCIDCVYPKGTGRLCGNNAETNEQVKQKCKDLGGHTMNQKFLKFV